MLGIKPGPCTCQINVLLSYIPNTFAACFLISRTWQKCGVHIIPFTLWRDTQKLRFSIPSHLCLFPGASDFRIKCAFIYCIYVITTNSSKNCVTGETKKGTKKTWTHKRKSFQSVIRVAILALVAFVFWGPEHKGPILILHTASTNNYTCHMLCDLPHSSQQ
jgi:hypothetical protein